MQPTAIERGAAVAPGVHEDFGHLLGLYMRRIRASASGVATEIGLSREAVNNWRNGFPCPIRARATGWPPAPSTCA
nr:hypothetical protein [Delftia acidovorans]